MLKRTHLRHFIALAETGGFTAAARRLNIAQPTLSASIAEIERQAGAALVVRNRRAIRLTEAGHQLFVKARLIEREFRAAEDLLAPARAPLPPLRLGVLASLSTAMIANLRRRFGEAQPLALIEGSDADLRRRLGERQIDGALTLLRDSEAAEAREPVLDEGYAVLLSAAHPLAGRRELAPEEVAGETMIARRSCEILSETSRFFTARGVRPHFLLRSVHEDRCLALVREGFAITTGPVSLAGGGIVAVPLHGYAYRRRVGLVMPGGEDREAVATAWAAAVLAGGIARED